MSYISQRSQTFKTHEKRGHLTNALSAYIDSRTGGRVGSDMYAYELKDGKYQLMWHIEAGTPNTELPWKKTIRKPYQPRHIQCQCANCK